MEKTALSFYRAVTCFRWMMNVLLTAKIFFSHTLQTPLTAAHFILVQWASRHHEYPSATFSLITGISAAPPSRTRIRVFCQQALTRTSPGVSRVDASAKQHRPRAAARPTLLEWPPPPQKQGQRRSRLRVPSAADNYNTQTLNFVAKQGRFYLGCWSFYSFSFIFVNKMCEKEKLLNIRTNVQRCCEST